MKLNFTLVTYQAGVKAAEVGSRRRAWPESVRERVFELQNLGLTFDAITKRTGISYFTIKNWNQKNREEEAFHSLSVSGNYETAVVELEPATVTVTGSSALAASSSPQLVSVTVTTPDGFRLEINEINAVISIINGLRAHRR